jgi:predicted PolB exonuclease-like 3'-5' exonuclease
MLGFPGKMGMDGSRVWDTWLAGDLKLIRDYCETDVLNTYLVYLRFELIRGNLDSSEYQQECELLASTLKNEARPHFMEFLEAWQTG